MAMAVSTKPNVKLKLDPKSPPKSQRSHRPLAQRAGALSVREPDHEAFGLEPPPTRGDIARMMSATAVRTLKDHSGDAETVDAVCERWASLTGKNAASRQEAAASGAIPAIVEAMGKHAANPQLIEKTIGALGNLVCGTDEEGLGRKQLAADSGVMEAVIEGMKAHSTVSGVQANGGATLGNVASNVDAPGLARKHKAVKAGAIEGLVAALTTHKLDGAVVDCCCFALGNLVRSRGDQAEDADGDLRKQSAVDAGAIPALAAAMNAHMDKPRVQDSGSRAIANITFRNDAFKAMAVEAGKAVGLEKEAADWLEGACTARIFVPDKERENAEVEVS